MAILSEWLRKNILVAFLSVCIVGGVAVSYLFTSYRAQHTNAALQAHTAKLSADYDQLKKKYADLETDRNNVLEQTKNLVQEKSKWTEMEEEFQGLKKSNALFMDQKDKIHSENQKLKHDLAAIMDHFDQLKESYQEIQVKQDKLDTENAGLRTLLAKKIQEAPEYQALSRELGSFRNENKTQSNTIKTLDAKLKKALDYIKKIQDRDLKFAKQAQGSKKTLDALKTENVKLQQTNGVLNKNVEDTPDHFRKMAEQNRTLLKETAEMHYNMGVLFTQNKNYPLAVKEFLRALDFDPNNVKAHYNLGYIYSEQMDKHDEAMSHFEKYLELNPDGKESESIRSYLMVRNAYGDAAPARK